MPPPVPMGGAPGPDALMSALKNLVTAVNTALASYLNVQGVQTRANLTSATVVKQGAGRVATVSVTVAGSAPGLVYDANAANVTTSPIWVIPNTVGAAFINMPVTSGILVAPGTGQTVAISYS